MNEWHDAEQRVERAQELFAQRQWQEALDELRAAIAINPYNSAWYFNVGLILDEMGRFDEAIEAYTRALKIEPEDVEALHRLGMDQLRLGRLNDALATFNQIGTLDAAYEPSYCGRILVYTELGDHEKAEEMFYLGRQYKEECPHCFAHVAESLRQRKLFDRAIYCWQKALDLDASYPQVHLAIAEALWEKGEYEKARQHYLQELRLNPGDTHALLDLGELLMEMGRVDEAGEKFRRAIELDPQEPETHLHYGRWLLGCDNAEGARRSFEKALNLDSRCPGARMYLGAVALREGDAAAAREHLRAELRSKPDDANVLLDLANLLMDCEQYRPAAACLKRLLAANGDHPAAWHNLAVGYFYLGRYEEGIAACHQALRCDSKQTTAMYNLALAYEHQADYDRALAWLHRAAELDPKDPSLQRLELRIRILTGLRWLRGKLGRVMFWRKPTECRPDQFS